MTPLEKVIDFEKRINELKLEALRYEAELINSITEGKKGKKIILTRPDGKIFTTQDKSDSYGGRKIWNDAGEVVAVDVRGDLKRVKYIIAIDKLN